MSHQSSLRPARCAPISLIVLVGWIVPFLLLFAAPGAQAQGPSSAGLGPSGVLFPEPFVVEHHLVQTTTEGDRFETEPVTDYYGGSWIVSVHPDGSRVVVDLARREVTGIQSERGTFWTVTFDRLGDLADQLVRAESRRPDSTQAKSSAERAAAGPPGAASTPPELVVEDLDLDRDRDLGRVGRPANATAAVRSGAPAGALPVDRKGVRHLRVVAKSEAERPGGGEDAGMEIWLDPTITLRPAAVAALDALGTVLGKGRGPDADPGTPSPDRYLAAARSHVPGAFPVRTVRTVGRGPATLQARLEDVTTRLERIDDFPEKLVAVPEGLRRVPHPLEGMVRFLKDETERDRELAGAKRGQ